MKKFLKELKKETEKLSDFNGFDGFELSKIPVGVQAAAGKAALDKQTTETDLNLQFSKSPGGATKTTAKLTVQLRPGTVVNIEKAYGVLFGFIAAMSNYSKVVKNIDDVTIVAVEPSGNENLKITSENGDGDRSEVIISTGVVAYNSFMGNLAASRFNCTGIRCSLNSANYIEQFSENITIYRRSMFGRATENSFNPASFIDPQQNQQLVVDVPVDFAVDKYTQLIVPVLTKYPDMVYTLDMYIEHIDY